MYLNKLLLKDFGKFNNKEMNLTTGINLIYGEKDSGKTTVKDFIVSMLFGIDNSRRGSLQIEKAFPERRIFRVTIINILLNVVSLDITSQLMLWIFNPEEKSDLM